MFGKKAAEREATETHMKAGRKSGRTYFNIDANDELSLVGLYRRKSQHRRHNF